ncbi:MAG: thiamine pyrophosphate-binding protein [Deltaproteobacteria bacterium]|nr:thiamine pyrophosphate-binding protein [Deltaproteobacteria bacterium]
MKRTGAEIIVSILRAHGVEVVFGIPSIHNLPLYEALRKDPAIRHILCRQETTATHMADGYARIKHRLGVSLTSTGPGTGYAVPAVQEAWGSDSPLLLITTNIPGDKIGKGTGALHELDGQDRLFEAITKEQVIVRSSEELGDKVQKAIDRVFDGRPGPVYLEIPTDLLRKPAEEPPDQTPTRGGTLSGDLPAAISLLKNARQPLMVVGTDAVRAQLNDDIKTLAETLIAPVISSVGGKGVLADDHPYCFGNGARQGVVRDVVSWCDVALAVGTRLREVDLKRRGLNLPQLIHVDWDLDWIGRNFPADVALTGDTSGYLKAILEGIEGPVGRQARQEWIHTQKERLDQEIKSVFSAEKALAYLQAIRRTLPRDGILVADNTMLGYWAEYFYPCHSPGTFMAAKGSSIIGFSFAAAMGVKLACPETPVAALIGDGGFGYSIQELTTCVRHGIGVPVIVVNDHGFGVIKHLQKTYYGHSHEAGLTNPDFTLLARSFGIEAEQVASPEDLARALKETLEEERMQVIELTETFPEPPFARY